MRDVCSKGFGRSEVLFEFAATGKPVVWCDFLALPWYRRGLFGHRLRGISWRAVFARRAFAA